MKKLPLARNSNVVVQDAGRELLIYDLGINKAFHLNETSTIIYLACNGRTTFEEVERQTGFTEDVILLALDQFKKDNLIEGEEISFSEGLTRRQVIRKIGFTTMVTLPLVSAMVAPAAMQAASGCPGGQSVCSGAPGGCCAAGTNCVFSTCCPSAQFCNPFTCCPVGVSCIGGFQCCPSTQVCSGGNQCCNPGTSCVSGVQCCPTPQICLGGGQCCPFGTVCVGGFNCCAPSQVCGSSQCCSPGQVCQGGVCTF